MDRYSKYTLQQMNIFTALIPKARPFLLYVNIIAFVKTGKL